MYELEVVQRQEEEQQAEHNAPVVPVTPPNSDTGNAPGTEAPAAPTNGGEKLFTQADLERQIDDRLKRERAKNENATQKAKQEADERHKTEQGEWQKLAEERKVRLDELEAKRELADRLTDLVGKQLDAEIATWPESVRAIMPPAETALLQRIDWAERTRPLARELLDAQAQQSNGMRFPAQHSGSGGNKPTTTKEIAMSALNKAYAPRKPIP